MSRLRKYLFSYRLDNEDWEIVVPAENEDAAKAIVARLTVAELKGEVVDRIWLIRGIAWLFERTNIMKALFVVFVLFTAIVAIFMAGCVSATYRNGEKSVTYHDLFKKVSDVQVNWTPEGVAIGIGNMSSELTAEDIAAYLKVMNAVNGPVK